jgi:4-amino-4-deoxychorismate lyase
MPAESALRDRDGTGFELIETLRWERGVGFIRLERHLERLYGSARELGFAYDPERVGEALQASLKDEPMLRIRLTLAADGTAACTAQPFAPLPPDTIWKLRIARTRLNAGDPLLRHKTSRRATYEAARAEFTHSQADEVILLNERGEVCEGTITSLFVDRGDGGPLATPVLSCGLLAGILRGEMLGNFEAVEAVLCGDDLKAAKAIFVGNSLRGLIRASFAG